MPLICASIGEATVLAMTSAVAPGYLASTVTIGGASSGYWEIGETNIATEPPSRIRIEMTDDRIGRSMKKWVNMRGRPPTSSPRRPWRLRRAAFAAPGSTIFTGWPGTTLRTPSTTTRSPSFRPASITMSFSP